MSELGTTFSHEDYCDLILVAIKKYPSSSSKVTEIMRRADTRSGTTSTTTAGPRTTARDLQNLSQIDFLELIAEIVSLHPQFIVKVRKACGRTAGRCPQPIDYEKIQDRFNDYVTNRDVDFDPDC